MSEENVEIVRALTEAFQRRDYERAGGFYDPEIEWHTGTEGVAPGMAGVYRGMDGAREFFERWLSAWTDLRFEIEDIRDAGDQVVLLIGDQTQTGRKSGVAIEFPPHGFVFTVRDRKIVRAHWYPDQESALEAAGLSG